MSRGQSSILAFPRSDVDLSIFSIRFMSSLGLRIASFLVFPPLMSLIRRLAESVTFLRSIGLFGKILIRFHCFLVFIVRWVLGRRWVGAGFRTWATGVILRLTMGVFGGWWL